VRTHLEMFTDTKTRVAEHVCNGNFNDIQNRVSSVLQKSEDSRQVWFS